MKAVETGPPLGCAAVMMGVFRAVLQEHHLPVTQQREAIAQALFESGRHLSAEDIVEKLREGGESVGKATVYRTLNLLVDVGLAVDHDFDEGFKRYKMSAGPSRHDHLICTSCGVVVEFQRSELDGLMREIAEAYGFHVLTRQVKLYGLCPTCGEAADADLTRAGLR